MHSIFNTHGELEQLNELIPYLDTLDLEDLEMVIASNQFWLRINQELDELVEKKILIAEGKPLDLESVKETISSIKKYCIDENIISESNIDSLIKRSNDWANEEFNK